MTCLLALDTATEACSVALLHKGQVYSRYQVAPRLHAKLLLPMIDEVLAEAGIKLEAVEAIAFGRGPGAFTGIRIAIGVVQGLAYALDKPVLPISDLAVIAQRAYREQGAQQVAVAIDARMDEVYYACYALNEGVMQLQGVEVVVAPELAQAPRSEADWLGAGTGWGAYAARMPWQPAQMLPELLPDAADLLHLATAAWQRGDAVPAEQAQPVYLRDKVATPKGA